jgi:hypothetical protein
MAMRRHHPHPLLSRAIGAALLAVAFLVGPSLRAQEGWDPFKQATSQIVHPNILIVMDRSGSLSFATQFTQYDQWDYDWSGNGFMMWAFYYNNSINGNGTTAADYSVQLNSRHIAYYDPYAPYYGVGDGYWLKAGVTSNGTSIWYFIPPSREAIFKNALGNSITLYQPSVQPSGKDQYGKPYYAFSASAGGPQGGAYYDYQNDTWVNYSDTTKAPVPDPAYSNTLSPQDLVGSSSNKVNWGLVIFYGTSTQKLVQVNPDDTQQAASVTTIESYLQPVSQGGLNPYNGTPTSQGLDEAKASLTATYQKDTAAVCGRTYATLLITDGESNTCNPNGSEWSNACSTTNLTTIAQYPPGRADELFLGGSASNDTDSNCTSSATSPTHVRTFVVGVSSDISSLPAAVCELNMDAYFGRTDASAADGGMNLAQDANRLPQNNSGTTTLANYNPSSGNYAYFANTAAQFQQAITSIIAAAGAGDYSTGAPVVSNNLVNSGNIAYVSSVTYPAMQGHLYSYDEQVLSQPTLLWDAGQVLASRSLSTAPRIILTWDPANPSQLYNLSSYAKWSAVPGAIQTILLNAASGTTATAAGAFYFLQGYTGAVSGQGSYIPAATQRTWLLGPVIDSTAAIIGAPQVWTGKSSLPSHVSFEQTYAGNHPLIMVGSSDGMLHFFDVADGYEVFAILPPDQLANQVQLYQQYATGKATATGQLADPSKQVYGVASSPRFADVYLSDNAYHTVLLLTEGKGGRSLAAIDITHPYPGRTGVIVPYVTVSGGTPVLNYQTGVTYSADANYPKNGLPVSILWYKDGALPSSNGSSYSKLGQTWSVPAMGFTNGSGSSPQFSCVLGSGFQPTTSYSDPYALQLNIQDGSPIGSPLDLNTYSPTGTPLVYNQAYGAGVLYDNTAPLNRPNDMLNLGVVSDTHGNVWSVSASNGTWGATPLFSPGACNPIYYTPAVGYYAGYDVYAYASGNFYEVSPNVTGGAATSCGYGGSSVFQSTVYMTLVDPTGSKLTLTTSALISSFTYTDSSGHTKNVPATAQLTSDPMLFIPANAAPSSSMPVKAYFTFYDPNPALGCGGASFLVKMQLDFTKISGSSIPAGAVTTTASYLGSGASSGIAFSGGKIIVAKSAIGTGSAAPQQTSESAPTTINQAPGINAWQELQ